MHGADQMPRGLLRLFPAQLDRATKQEGQQRHQFLNEMLLLCRVSHRQKLLSIRRLTALF